MKHQRGGFYNVSAAVRAEICGKRTVSTWKMAEPRATDFTRGAHISPNEGIVERITHHSAVPRWLA